MLRCIELEILATVESGETISELYLLSEDEDGNLVNEVPGEFEYEATESIYIGVGNLEHTDVSYTVIVQLEHVDHDSGEVLESVELDRFERTLEHGNESVEERSIQPTLEGEQLRLTVLLYTDDPPSEPTVENAYRDVYAWIDVVEND